MGFRANLTLYRDNFQTKTSEKVSHASTFSIFSNLCFQMTYNY